MKRYYVAAVFFIIIGGLFAYIRFHQGNIRGAIRMGIIYLLIGVFAFCYGKFRPQFSLAVIAYNVIVTGLMAAYAASTGDIVWAIFLCIGLILVGVPMLNRDKPFVKKAMRPLLEPAPYVGIVVSLVVWLLLLLST